MAYSYDYASNVHKVTTFVVKSGASPENIKEAFHHAEILLANPSKNETETIKFQFEKDGKSYEIPKCKILESDTGVRPSEISSLRNMLVRKYGSREESKTVAER